MLYLGSPASFSVNMEKVKGDAPKAFWIDPRSGNSLSVGSVPTSGMKSFATPDGWEDALLVLESSGGKS